MLDRIKDSLVLFFSQSKPRRYSYSFYKFDTVDLSQRYAIVRTDSYTGHRYAIKSYKSFIKAFTLTVAINISLIDESYL